MLAMQVSEADGKTRFPVVLSCPAAAMPLLFLTDACTDSAGQSGRVRAVFEGVIVLRWLRRFAYESLRLRTLVSRRIRTCARTTLIRLSEGCRG